MTELPAISSIAKPCRQLFRVTGSSMLTFGILFVLYVWLNLDEMPVGRWSGVLGWITGGAVALFGIAGAFSMAAWYLSRKTQEAASTAFILGLALVIVVPSAERLHAEWARHSFHLGPTPNVVTGYHPRDLVDIVLEESTALPPKFVNDRQHFDAYITELVRQEHQLGRNLSETEKQAIIIRVLMQ